MEAVSFGALVVALLVALWKWRVSTELRAIREALENIGSNMPTEPDAGCEPGLPRRADIPDDDTVWLVLFASVLFSGLSAIEARAAEWRALFGSPDE